MLENANPLRLPRQAFPFTTGIPETGNAAMAGKLSLTLSLSKAKNVFHVHSQVNYLLMKNILN